MAADIFGVDRRTFSLGMLMALTAACNTGATRSQAQSQTFDPFWTLWRDRYLAPEGRVVDTGNNGISHSEGQSYGLLFAYRAGDLEAFGRIADWTQRTLAREDVALHRWRYDPSAPNPLNDHNNATDGDIVIAWALAMAGQAWSKPDWLERSAQIRSAIRSRCVIERYDRKLLIPGLEGFVEPGQVILNPSYFVWPALDNFATLDGNQAWGDVIADCEDILRRARFGRHKLPCDWLSITAKNAIAPAPDKPPRFGYDAIRVPLFALLGYRTALAAPVEAYWRGCLKQQRPIPAWIDVITGEEANYALSNGGAAVAGRLLGTASPAVLADDYYAASLQMLARP